MKKLMHAALLALFCLLLLLGTNSFFLYTATDGAESREVFSFVQNDTGVCEISVLGHGTDLSLLPLARVRKMVLAALAELPHMLGNAVATFGTRVVDALT